MVFFLIKRWICLSFLPFFLLNKSGEIETLNIYNIKRSLIWNTHWVTIYVVRNQLCKLYHYTKSYKFSIATNTWTFMTDRNRCYYQANSGPWPTAQLCQEHCIYVIWSICMKTMAYFNFNSKTHKRQIHSLREIFSSF